MARIEREIQWKQIPLLPEHKSLLNQRGNNRTKEKVAAELHKENLLRAERMLASAGFSYILKHADGREVVYDPQKLLPKQKKAREHLFPRNGELTNYVEDYLKQLVNVGDVVCVPNDGTGLKRVRSAASSVAGALFGTAKQNGGSPTYSTYINEKEDCVEVMLHVPVGEDEEFLKNRSETNNQTDN